MTLNLDRTGWKRVPLGQVAAASKNKVDPTDGSVERFIAGEHMDTDDLKIHRWGVTGEVDLGPAFHRGFRPGQVLYGSRRTYLRKVAVAEFEGVCANTTFVVETKDQDALLQEFLPFVMTAEPFHAFAIAESKGSVNPYVNWSDLERYEFDLPPVDEQKRLADLLWAVERRRRALDVLADRTRTAFDVVIRDMWLTDCLRPISAIGDCVTGSTPSKSNREYWKSEDLPFYTPSEIDGGDSIRPARQKVSHAGAAAGRSLPPYSVAVACIGGDMGKSAVIQEPGISNQQITSVVGLAADDAYALQAVLSHPLGRAGMEARETTTIVRKLNKSDLMRVEVPWPDERTALHALVETKRSALSSLRVEEDGLVGLRSAVLAEVFGGN